MARYSPTARVQTTVPTVWDALGTLLDEGAAAAERHRIGKEREAERARLEEDRERELAFERRDRHQARIDRDRRRAREDLATAMDEIKFHEAGGRRFPDGPPQRELSPEEDVFRGSRPGMAARGPEAEGIFAGARPGMAGGNAALAEGLGALLEEGLPRKPKLVAPAGAFVRGMGFAPKNIFDTDLAGGLGMQRPTARTGPDSRFVHLQGDRFLDTAALEEEEPEEERLRFTEEELRAAGIPAGMIPAALRDPLLARQLMAAAGRDSGGGSSSVPASVADRRARDERDAYLSQLIARGERNPGRLLEETQRRFPNTPTTLRDVEAQLMADDPIIEQRRDAIVRVAHPVQYGGGRILYQIVEDLAKGRSRAQIEQLLAEAFAGEEDDPEYQNALAYLGVLAAAESLRGLLEFGGGR